MLSMATRTRQRKCLTHLNFQTLTALPDSIDEMVFSKSVVTDKQKDTYLIKSLVTVGQIFLSSDFSSSLNFGQVTTDRNTESDA